MENTVSQENERTVSVHQEHEFLKKLEVAGLDTDLAQKVIDSKGNEMAMKVVRFIASYGFEPTDSQKRARKIMGKNMFGVEEAIRHFDIKPSRQQLSILSEVPFSEETLQACKNSHVLVAVFPLSILYMLVEMTGKTLLNNQDWSSKEAFVEEKGKANWQLVKKSEVDNSVHKILSQQLVLLTEDDEVPTARTVVYTTVGHFLATTERLFKNICVRTSTVGPDGNRVRVRFSGKIDIFFYGYSDNDPVANLGIASARKSLV